MSYSHSTSTNPDFESDITDDEVHSMESFASAQETGIRRRLSLVVCSRDADTLRKIRDETPEAFADLKTMVEDFRTHAHALVDIAKIAHARLRQIDSEARRPVTLM